MHVTKTDKIIICMFLFIFSGLSHQQIGLCRYSVVYVHIAGLFTK